MRYLKRQNINRRTPNDTTVYSDVSNTNVFVSPVNLGSLVLPNGTTSQRNGTYLGAMRYNTTTNEVEVYQGSTGSATANWRPLRFKEPTAIIQQNLGAGDGQTTLFGPLNSAYIPNKLYYSTDIPQSGGASNGQYGGQNILVVVENVLQLSGANYSVTASPSIAGEAYIGTVSQAATVSSTQIFFSTSLIGTSTSSSGSVSFTGFISNGSGPSTTTGTTLTVTSGSAPTTGMTLSGTGISGQTIVAANSAAFTGYTTASSTTLNVTAVTSSIITIGMVVTGSNMTPGTYISALGSGTGGVGTYTLSQSQSIASGTSGSPVPLTATSYTVSSTALTASETITGTGVTATIGFASQTGNPFAIGDTIVVAGFTPTGYNGKYTVTASTSSSVSYTCVATGSMITAGTVTSGTAIYPSVNILGAVVSGSASIPNSTTLSTVSITSNAGAFSCTSTTLAVNQAVTISGTNGGSGVVSNGTYYIIATNGTTTFTLGSYPGATTGISTTAGSPSGLTFTVPTCVLSYNTDPTTDALLNVTISKAVITSTIPVLTSLTLTEPTISYTGNYLQFTSPVPYGKTVTALLGFDA